MIKILIADDHQMMIDGIQAMLKDQKDFKLVGIAHNGTECLEIVKNQAVDVILLDINMPDINGIEICKRVKKSHPAIKILALTMLVEGNFISKMVHAGANGYIIKNTGKKELIQAINAVNDGKNYFSEEVAQNLISGMMPEKDQKSGATIPKVSRREKEVLELILKEHTTQEIADKLFISLNTVEAHRRNLLIKFKARNSIGLVKKTLELGLLD